MEVYTPNCLPNLLPLHIRLEAKKETCAYVTSPLIAIVMYDSYLNFW